MFNETPSNNTLIEAEIDKIVTNLRSRFNRDTLLTTRLAAIASGVSEATVKRWCDKQYLKCAKTPNGHRRINMVDLAEFIVLRKAKQKNI